MKTELNIRNEQGVCFKCGHCGAVKPVRTNGGTGYGYATHESETPVCYECLDQLQIEELKNRNKRVLGYVGDGIITTWTGGKLMTITRSRPCELTRHSYMHSRRSYMSIHAVDVHGGHWAGRGSNGVLIKLRPVKGR